MNTSIGTQISMETLKNKIEGFNLGPKMNYFPNRDDYFVLTFGQATIFGDREAFTVLANEIADFFINEDLERGIDGAV